MKEIIHPESRGQITRVPSEISVLMAVYRGPKIRHYVDIKSKRHYSPSDPRIQNRLRFKILDGKEENEPKKKSGGELTLESLKRIVLMHDTNPEHFKNFIARGVNPLYLSEDVISNAREIIQENAAQQASHLHLEKPKKEVKRSLFAKEVNLTFVQENPNGTQNNPTEGEQQSDIEITVKHPFWKRPFVRNK